MNRPTRDECIANAGRHVADAYELRDRLSPRDAAIAAHRPGDDLDALEDRIRDERGLAPLDRRVAS